MEYGAIDLHMKKSQVRIVDEDGIGGRGRDRIDTRRDAFEKIFGDRAADADPAGERHGERVGGADAGGPGPRGGGGRSELRADVWHPQPPHQDRCARCDGDERGQSARGVSPGASRLAGAAPGAPRADGAQASRADADAGRSVCCGRVLRQDGLRLRSGSADRILTRLASVTIPAALEAVIAPLRAVIADIEGAGDRGGRRRSTRGRATDPVAQRLMTAPGVGPVMALAFPGGARRSEALWRGGAVARVRLSGWSPRRIALASVSTKGTSRRRARPNCGPCWCRRVG